ncbi:MAG: hypothetical protein EOP53_25790 [Sphingobacteriales bacterium]|nr:MAG: hypothetical protein EOP53_25790 [Sphingobacteriales bacterium]
MPSRIAPILFLFITLTAGFTQCRTSNSMPAQYKSIYIDQFKLTYFKYLLKKSYNNSAAIQEIIRLDHSGFTEPLVTEDDIKFIDSLTDIDNEKLKTDSLDGYRRAEGGKGKRPLEYIMHKIDDKWLDRIARKRLKLSGVPESWKN